MRDQFKCKCGRRKSRTAKQCGICRSKELRAARKHGTVNMYQNFGCRCSKCKAGWAKQRRDQRAAGRA